VEVVEEYEHVMSDAEQFNAVVWLNILSFFLGLFDVCVKNNEKLLLSAVFMEDGFIIETIRSSCWCVRSTHTPICCR